MNRPRVKDLPVIDLRCSCSGEMVGHASPVSKIAPLREIFMSAHSEPGCVVTDRSSDIDSPPTGPAPLLQGDAVELPGFETVPTADTRSKSWTA